MDLATPPRHPFLTSEPSAIGVQKLGVWDNPRVQDREVYQPTPQTQRHCEGIQAWR
jgi:hypothetical protein